MDHILEINSESRSFLEHNLFPSIYKGETVLFLGAGASVTSKKYLSGEVIEYYQDKLGIDLGTKNLVEFVDLLSARPDFNRNDFDNYIVKMLDKLDVSNTHKKIASIQWREIITTNYDLLIEKAFDSQSRASGLKLKPVRKKEEYSGYNIPTEIKYVKLNGCASDKSKYPLVFSTKDFTESKKYYRTIFSSLEALSPNINFVSFGFSFTDGLSDYLIEKFDSYNFRNKRWMFSLDPFINIHRLPYFTEKRICVLKMTTEEFFTLYTEWEGAKASTLVKRKGITFVNKEKKHVVLPFGLKNRIGNSIIQLSDVSYINSILPQEFYKGQQPTYDVIRRNYDVIKLKEINVATTKIKELLKNQKEEKIIPILFLNGHFGGGKSTFTYRAIHSLLNEEPDTLAFEVIDPEKLSESDLSELFNLGGVRNIILLCNELEVDSSFKELMDLRNRLSVEQLSELNIIILSSIRENILSRYLKKYTYRNYHLHNINLKLNKSEATDFVDKLSNASLIKFRDVNEKNNLIDKITSEFNGDTFVSLLSLIGKNENYFDVTIQNALNQLTEKAKQAFIYTSLLYQFKLNMPASLLMKIVSKDWEKFKTEILEENCEGLLIQEISSNSLGSEPDLYFKTKHPVISEQLVKKLIKSEDKLYDRVRKMLSFIHESPYNSRLVINLFKALRDNDSLSQEKLNKLFDVCADEFESDQHFNLHYAMNVQQNRKDLVSLKNALTRLSFSGSSMEKRNHRIVHRRASIHFDVARKYFSEGEYGSFNHHIEEARELFGIKLAADPFSSFSYLDYILMELWCLRKLDYANEDLLRQHITIQNLFDLAENSLYEDTEKIAKLKAKYLTSFYGTADGENKSLMEYLDGLYEGEETRPYALTLKYNYFSSFDRMEEAVKLVEELEYYRHIDDVAVVLFKHYGRNLYDVQNVIKFFDIVAEHPFLKTKEKLRFNFYSYVAEAYNRNFQNIGMHLNNIRISFNHLNPSISDMWFDPDTIEPRVFDALIVKNHKGQIMAKIVELQQSFYLLKRLDNKPISEGSKPQVYLHFYLRGIRAEIIE